MGRPKKIVEEVKEETPAPAPQPVETPAPAEPPADTVAEMLSEVKDDAPTVEGDLPAEGLGLETPAEEEATGDRKRRRKKRKAPVAIETEALPLPTPENAAFAAVLVETIDGAFVALAGPDARATDEAKQNMRGAWAQYLALKGMNPSPETMLAVSIVGAYAPMLAKEEPRTRLMGLWAKAKALFKREG